MKLIQVACAIIINKNKILVAQRSEKMKLPLKWEFPGGKINPGESIEECLHRELKEELNITVEIIARIQENKHRYENFTINLIPFIVKYKEGDIQLLEHKSFLWLNKNELLKLDWAPADIPIVHNFLLSNLV